MTVMVSDDEGVTFSSARAVVVCEGGSFYSNLADGGGGDVLLIFERAGNTSSRLHAGDAAPPVAAAAVDWASVTATTAAVPTYLDQVNPSMSRTSAIHDAVFDRIKELGADRIRYLHWDPFPEISLPEPTAPANGTTSWRFGKPWTSPVSAWSHAATNCSIDDYVEDFMTASEGHDSVINFSPLPPFMLFPPPAPPPPPPPKPIPPPPPNVCRGSSCVMVPTGDVFFFGGPAGFGFQPNASTLVECMHACLSQQPCVQATWWPGNPNRAQWCALYWDSLEHNNVSRPGVSAATKCQAGSTVASKCGPFLPGDGHATSLTAAADAPQQTALQTPLGPRDPSGLQAGQYFSRIISWYTKGNFTDELGVLHRSGHHYRWKHCESQFVCCE